MENGWAGVFWFNPQSAIHTPKSKTKAPVVPLPPGPQTNLKLSRLRYGNTDR